MDISSYEHLTEFVGLPVVDWEVGKPLEEPATTAYRISVDGYNETNWLDKFAAFLANPTSQEVTAFLVGYWPGVYDEVSSASIVEALAAARDQLPNLKAIFLGEIISEECEISWINQSNVSPILAAYPQLEHFVVRGGNGLSFKTKSIQHAGLKTLIVQSGGLDVQTVYQINELDLPELTHLELWLGTPDYGGDAGVVDLEPLLEGQLFPKLTYLGLRDSEIVDEIAEALATAPIVERLKVLDLSLGTLSDKGAEALLTNKALAQLEKLDIHHHYCSPEVVAKFEALSIEVNASDPQTAEVDYKNNTVYRYIAVSE